MTLYNFISIAGIILLTGLSTTTLSAQERPMEVDQAIKLIEQNEDDPRVLHKAYKIVWGEFLYEEDDEKFRYYIKKGTQTFQERDMPAAFVDALTYKARGLVLRGKRDEATPIFYEALEYAKMHHPPSLSSVYDKLSIHFKSGNMLDSASYFIYKALENAENNQQVVRSKSLLVDIQMDLGLYSEAREEISFILQNKDALNTIEQFIAYGTAVMIYGQLKDYDLYAASFIELKKLQEKFDSPSENFHSNTLFYENLAHEEKTTFLENSLAAFQRIGYQSEIGNTKVALATHHFDNREYKKVGSLIENWAVEEDAQIKLIHKANLLDKHKSVLRILGDFKRALEIQDGLTFVEKQMDSLQNVTVLLELDKKYQTALKDQALQEKEIDLNRNTYQRNLLMAGLAILLTSGGLFIWGLLGRIKRNKEINLQKMAIQDQQIVKLEQEKKLLSLSSLLEGQESERIRIAKDLHDGLGGLLTTVKAHFSKIQAEIVQVSKLDIYDSAHKLIDKAYDEIRRISHNLMPSDLRAGGIQLALQQLAQELRSVHEIDTEFELIGFADDRFDEKLELSIYRITQELITNILKYADASHIFLQVSKFEDEIQIVIEDNGVGFDLDKVLKNEGLGLKSVLSRVEQSKGEIDIETGNQKGTSITINLPILT